ncbi:protein SMAX1-like [Curcuma longa]|uniref:protein SMAX1-like n=1 Tax=Curcuma longa TaxID=136217 RepID=UPI003D9DCD4A
MRAELSTIQQMLTPEAASVLARSIVEAVQRKHARITPLHVAAVLLAAPSGILRRSCLSSHPDSAAHPLRCRALELCFSVALDRLPSDGGRDAAQPPMSNALKAALKRAQANQRRGCPEQPQQPAAPLLAVKVELEQLVVSILDDPQVSRVMREAGFSSTVVKGVVEQSLSSSSSNSSTSSTITAAVLSTTTSPVSSVPPSPAHLYVNPRLHNGSGAAATASGEQPRTEEVKRVMSTLSRSKKRNPVLVSDIDPEAVIQEVIQKIESGAAPPPLHTAKVVSFAKDLPAATASGDKSWIAAKIRELGSVVESQLIGGDHGVVVDIGDLKWLVESSARPPTITSPKINAQQTVSETARTAVAEMATLLKSFRDGGRQVWLLGTATWTTYLRCQVYHPTMEDDWDLQAVQIAPRSQNFPRTSQQFPGTINSATNTGMCALCTEGYRHDMTKGSHQPPPKVDENKALPPWLQLAKLRSESCTTDHQHKETLLKKWQHICSRLHSKASPPSPLLLCSGNSPAISLPEISVKTDLVLGNSAICNPNEPKKVEFLNQKKTNFAGVSDIDTFKRLYKGLLDKVSWQPEVASAMAATVLRLKSESRRRGHSWLLYLGPDKIGKRKMATALSELVFGTPPVVVKLGGDDEEEGECTVSSFRGRTSMDRVVEAIRRNPFAVVLIEEFDRTDDVLVRGSIKRAMEQGRMVDSHGREVSLGSAIFIMTSSWLPEELQRSHESLIKYEEKVLRAAARGQGLELSAEKNTSKRCVDWLRHGAPPTKLRRPLSLDLNLAMGTAEDDDPGEGSSDVTVERDVSKERLDVKRSTSSVAAEMAELADGAVVFEPVDFSPMRQRAAEGISGIFAAVMGEKWSMRVDEEATDRIVGCAWIAGEKLDEWSERVLTPRFKELKGRLKTAEGEVVVRLSIVERSGAKANSNRSERDWTPAVRVAVEGA